MQPFSQVMEFRISPDGHYVVYKADPEADNIYELYSVPLAGGAPVKLNLPLEPDRSINGFEISPDSSRVAYGLPTETPRSFELYSVPVAGPASSSVKLNGPLVVDGNVLSFRFTPNGSYVVYRADRETNGVYELYSVPAAGPASGSLKLNPPLTPGGIVFSFQISPDSSRVVYMADQVADGALELFSVPLRGPSTQSVKLNSTPVPGGGIFRYDISPNSSRVVYIADLLVDDLYEVFSASITGGASSQAKLNRTLVPTGDVKSFTISPDSRWVVYRADQEIDSISELYNSPIAGPAASTVKLNEPLPARGDIFGFRISADSQRVVYRVDQRGGGPNLLYSVPGRGPATAGVLLNPPQVSGGSATSFELSPDGQWVVFSIGLLESGIADLYSAPIAGPAGLAIRLNPPLPPGGSTFNFQINPDSTHVVYRAELGSAGVIELYSTPIRGPAGATEKLNGPLSAGGNVLAFAISPDNRRVVFTADTEMDRKIELFAAGDEEVIPPTATPGPTVYQYLYLPEVFR